MNSPRAGLRLASLIFGIMCLAHAWRLFAKFDIRLGTHNVPMSLSVVAVIVAGTLSIWLWKLSNK
jgi:hypothetical protein